MKKIFLVISALSLTLAGCVTNEEDITVAFQKKITFQTAKCPITRTAEEQINGSKFTYDHFVTHAWSDAVVNDDDAVVNDDKVFMYHQKVTKNESANAWMPTVDYYWPNYSTVDFISYYPEQPGEEKNYPKVERGKLTYIGYDVLGPKADINESTNDLMYAEKAVGYNGNIDRVNDDNGGTSDSGYSGVPTLFHHALAQLEIRVLVQHPGDETESHWEAVIDHAKLNGYYTKGDLELELNDPSLKHGVTGWIPKGETEIAKKVGWEPSGAATSLQLIGDGSENEITISSTGSGDGYVAEEKRGGCMSLFKTFVLPQTLTDQHLFELKFTLNKYRGNTLETSEADTEIRHIQLKTTAIPYWGMNQKIVYTIVINPAKKGKIMFDPAVVDWEDVNQDKDADDTLPDYYIEIPNEDDWGVSNVWYAYDENGQKIAEMAKELIRDPELNYYQAVVVNPVVNGKTDLKNGFIAQVLKSSTETTDNLAGGSISYMRASEKTSNHDNVGGLHSAQLGNQANFDYCKVENGKIVGIRDIKGLTKRTNKAYTVIDNETDNNVYGVVRTGAIYWLRENLRATYYNDGKTPIANAATTTVTYYDTDNQPTGVVPRVFHDKAAYIAPEGGTDDDIKKYGYLYNFRAVSGGDENGDYKCTDVVFAKGDLLGRSMPSSCLCQQGVFPAGQTNKSICPEGWRIPHIFYQSYQMWASWICDMDYLDNWLISEKGSYLMSEGQTLPGKEILEAPNNFSGFSLNVCQGFGQEEGSFVLSDDYTYSPFPTVINKYIIPFWTANLIKCSGLLYPAPGIFIADERGNVNFYFYTNNYLDKNKGYPELIGKNYYPIRCMRIE